MISLPKTIALRKTGNFSTPIHFYFFRTIEIIVSNYVPERNNLEECVIPLSTFLTAVSLIYVGLCFGASQRLRFL